MHRFFLIATFLLPTVAHGQDAFLAPAGNMRFERFPANVDVSAIPGATEAEFFESLVTFGESPIEDGAGNLLTSFACLEREDDAHFVARPLPLGSLEDGNVTVSSSGAGLIRLVVAGGQLEFARGVCGAEQWDAPFLTLPQGAHAVAGTSQLCGVFERPSGEVCFATGCNGQPDRWDEETQVYCVDPADSAPMAGLVATGTELMDAVVPSPRWSAELGVPVGNTGRYIGKRIMLPDGRLVFMVSFGFDTWRIGDSVSSLAVHALVGLGPDGSAEPIAEDLYIHQGELLAYDAELDAILMGPASGTEFDHRTFTVAQYGGGSIGGGDLGQWVGRALYVVSLDEPGRGILSYSDALVRHFEGADWDSLAQSTMPWLRPNPDGVFYTWQGNFFRLRWDLDALDLDRDGLSRARENELGTSDYWVDSDFDGRDDHMEVFVHGTDPADFTDGPNLAEPVHFSAEYAHICPPDVETEPPTWRAENVEGTVVVHRPDGEWYQLGPDALLEPRDKVWFAGPERVIVEVRTSPADGNHGIYEVTPAGKSPLFLKSDAVEAAGGYEVENELGGSSRAWEPRGAVGEILGRGYVSEHDLFLVDVSTTQGYFLVGVRSGVPPFMVSNMHLQGLGGRGLAEFFVRRRLEYPQLERRTPQGEYMYKYGVVNSELHPVGGGDLGAYSDVRREVIGSEQQRELNEFGRVRRTIEPGDTLVLAPQDTDTRGTLLNGSENDLRYMLWKFDPRGYRAPLWDEPQRFERVTGMGYGELGYLCVADRDAGKLTVYRTLGAEPTQVPTTFGAEGDVPGIVSCAMDGTSVYILASEEPKLQRYDFLTNETETLTADIGEKPFQISVVDGEVMVADENTGPQVLTAGGRHLRLNDGWLVVDGQTNGLFDAYIEGDEAPPSGLPVILGERADGLVLGLGSDVYDELDFSRAGQPNQIGLIDPANQRQRVFSNTFNWWTYDADYNEFAMTTVPGEPRHPCTGQVVEPGVTPILVEPGDDEGLTIGGAPAPPSNGTPVPMGAADEGCCRVVGSGEQPGWPLALLGLLALVRRRRD